MRTKFYNKDIASQLATKTSDVTPKDEHHLSAFTVLPIELKESIIESIADAQIDYLKESMSKSSPIATIPYIGRFTYSANRVFSLELYNEKSLSLYNKVYKLLSEIQKKEIKVLCKPTIVDKVITTKDHLKGIAPKNRNSTINISSFFNKGLH